MCSSNEPKQEYTEGEMIRLLLEGHLTSYTEQAVFVETGSGLSTLALAEMARRCGAIVYSCDINAQKIEELKRRATDRVNNVNFLVANSLESLSQIAQRHSQIHFAFFDSAPSAMHTFREFQTIEQCLKSGSLILIDNAARPGETRLLTPCRKGKILVPYLLASANWRVQAHPSAGGSMVSAEYFADAAYADPSYERADRTDHLEGKL